MLFTNNFKIKIYNFFNKKKNNYDRVSEECR